MRSNTIENPWTVHTVLARASPYWRIREWHLAVLSFAIGSLAAS